MPIGFLSDAERARFTDFPQEIPHEDVIAYFMLCIGKQLNKGEALHALRRFLFLANQGQIRHAGFEEQVNQVSCLNLVANAVVAWNTVYMGAVIEQLRADGHTINDSDVAHLSPARFEHSNPYGKYSFDLALARRTTMR